MELPSNLKSKHFLVCDDYESMRTMVCDSLKELGVTRITTAPSGNQGYKTILSKLASDPIDFVMTDLMMNDGSGIDLVKQIRADAKIKGLPVLMITSKSEVGSVLEAVKAGVNNYIVKPWALEDLCEKIIKSAVGVSKAATP
ncbi:MAG: response regulator [Bacteriovoracaceae bacterium]|nr:response regulator [Bacteriovoracaceae bacterium]